MAMQTGISLSKIFVIAGAGYTGTILLKNGKLSDILGELQSLVKGLENSGEQTDDSDALLAQVRRLSTEIRQLASARQIHVLNGDSGGKLSNLVVPAASLGALGYVYMWWKGYKFSDLFWVTKQSMAIAVESLKKHLESVSDALSAAKKHLTQRIQNLDDKMEIQKEISKSIQENVQGVHMNISNVECQVDIVHRMISGLDGKLDALELKQNCANAGVWYLCNMVGGKKAPMPEALQEQLQLAAKSRNLITNSGTPALMGLKDVMDILPGGPETDFYDEPRNLLRSVSAKC